MGYGLGEKRNMKTLSVFCSAVKSLAKERSKQTMDDIIEPRSFN